MPIPSSPGFAAFLQEMLGEDPAALEWPREFALPAAQGSLTALYDPYNASLTLYGARPDDLQAGGARTCLVAGAEAPALCTRVLVFAPEGDDGPWRDLGFAAEGRLADRPDGAPARLWARMWAERAAAPAPVAPPAAGAVRAPAELPAGWSCRVADPADAVEIRALMAAVFPGYPIPEDPGTIRYALAAGLVHGRLIRSDTGALAAYASAEFQPDGEAAEITDCATAPAHRGRGLMGHLVVRLIEDLDDVFDQAGAFALAREDRPAMAQVLARAGWRHAGRLVNHYRVGRTWTSAGLWIAAPPAEDS